MATLTNEQIEAKKQQLKQLAEEVMGLKNELVEAGAWPLDDNDLDEAAGGKKVPLGVTPPGLEKALRDWDNLQHGRGWLLGS